MTDKFFIVWNENLKQPLPKFDLKKDAVDEAKRLTTNGETFYVLKSITKTNVILTVSSDEIVDV